MIAFDLSMIQEVARLMLPWPNMEEVKQATGEMAEIFFQESENMLVLHLESAEFARAAVTEKRAQISISETTVCLELGSRNLLTYPRFDLTSPTNGAQIN